MTAHHHTARDISYADAAESRGGRLMIRLMENATGRLGLIRRAKGYDVELAQGRDFWSVIMERYGLTLEVLAGSLQNIPRNGPVVLVANHPYGILDGLMMGHMLQQARGDFRILAHQVFRNAGELNRVVLPVDFAGTKEALRTNIETRRTALEYLGQGGAVGIFPGGTVSTAARPFSRPMDPGWRSFTARMLAKSNAVAVPVYFDGHTSRLFQIASHLHTTLRMGLLIKEFRTRVGSPVRVVVGEPIGRDVLDPLAGDARMIMTCLRQATYALAPEPMDPEMLGFEFEAKHRAGDPSRAVCAAAAPCQAKGVDLSGKAT
ncbi:lysophospholipid acyltransferase family protein [Cribrihabitans neustonicus]|uniref:lysophospholipid acyltransferase family protein n=1 Tax=Cribrihabitans neustonicus TaxID=1429085 RepID=UPI003B5B74D2